MHLPAAILLGIIQGITEFLPISSSAHLILARAFFGWETPPALGLAFDVALHVGTLAAILAFFRAEVREMAFAVPHAISTDPPPAARLVRMVVLGTLPIVFVGLLFTSAMEEWLRRPQIAAVALTAGSIAMLIAERLGPRTRTEGSLRPFEAFLIGWAQAAALIPGMSRSGSTIVVGMFLGIRRDSAARFTFLLAIPAMIAAAGREALQLRHMEVGSDTAVLFLVGTAVSGLVGYITIKYFLRFLASHRLNGFAYYRLALAAATLVWLWRQ